MGHYTYAAQKVLKARTDQHQLIMGGGATPSLTDAATLTAPYGVSLTNTLAMTWGSHSRLRVVLFTLLGKDHPAALAM